MNALEQRLSALERANKVRTSQAAFSRRISRVPTREGCELVAAAIEGGEVDSFPVGRLLRSIRFVGHEKTLRLLAMAQVRSDVRKVDDLSDRQKARLVALLRARAW